MIVINGSGGVGKDTFIEYCSEFAKVKNISSIDKVKEAAKILVDWNGEKDEKSRKLLVDLKALSMEYNDAPFEYIKKQKQEFEQGEENILFVHVREISEIKKIKEELKAKTVLITNRNIPIITSNSSDANVLQFEYDYRIENDGTLEQLREKAKEFIENKSGII